MTETKLSYKFWASIYVACVGSFGFGFNWSNLNTISAYVQCWLLSTSEDQINYDIVCSNSSLLEDADFKPILTKWSSVASFSSLGAAVYSLFAGIIAEAIGRKKTSILVFLLSLTGSLLSATAFWSGSYAQILFGRIVTGISLSGFTTLFPPYLQEIAPKGQEPFYGSLFIVFSNLGFIIAQVLGSQCIRLS